MREIVKILLAVGVLAFAAGIMAVSCDKPADPNNNNANNSANNSGSGSGGSGGSGGGNTPIPNNGDIKITNASATLVKIKNDTNILIKLSALPTTTAYFLEANSFRDATTALIAGDMSKVFEIVNDKAKEGMVFVGKGNVPSAGAITTKAVGGFDGTTANDDEGIRIIPPRATASGNGVLPTGLSFMSVFANAATPTDNSPNTEPFAFSMTTRGGGLDAQPIFWCTATAPTITAAVVATDKLTGAHKASCYMAGRGFAFGGDNTITSSTPSQWLAHADPFKREIQVAVSAIRTDDKTIANLMPGANDAAKLANFNDGISATEMAAIVAANGPVPFKKFNIKLVNDADFAAP